MHLALFCLMHYRVGGTVALPAQRNVRGGGDGGEKHVRKVVKLPDEVDGCSSPRNSCTVSNIDRICVFSCFHFEPFLTILNRQVLR